jgi:peptidoglycan/LPS O-acetylase OafA/YrhL
LSTPCAYFLCVCGQGLIFISVDPITSPTKRLSYLDTARGLAAVSVVIWHYFTALSGYDQSALVNHSPFHFFWYGEADVIFFFIHSGFILTYSYANAETRVTVSKYVKYLIERGFRIYPLFLFILVVSWVLRRTIYPFSNGQWLSGHLLQYWGAKKDLAALGKEAILIVRIPDNANERLMPQDWTLTVELLVCPLVPLLALLLRKAKWLFWPLVIVMLWIFHFNTYLFEFATGVFIFFLWKDGKTVWGRVGTIVKLSAVVAAVLLYTVLFHFSPIFSLENMVFSPAIDRFMVVSGCALFFMIMISSARVQRWMSYPLLVRIGRSCYSLYLIHLLLLICFADYGMQVLHAWFAAAPFWLNGLILLLVYLFVTIALSFLTYRFVEKPFNQLGKKISRRTEAMLVDFGSYCRRRLVKNG